MITMTITVGTTTQAILDNQGNVKSAYIDSIKTRHYQFLSDYSDVNCVTPERN